MTRDFHLGTILSVTTGIQASPDNMRGISGLVYYMMGMPEDSGIISALLIGAAPCKASLLRQHPQLAGLEAGLEGVGESNYWARMGPLIDRFGERLPVMPLAEERLACSSDAST